MNRLESVNLRHTRLDIVWTILGGLFYILFPLILLLITLAQSVIGNSSIGSKKSESTAFKQRIDL